MWIPFVHVLCPLLIAGVVGISTEKLEKRNYYKLSGCDFVVNVSFFDNVFDFESIVSI